MKSLLTSEQQKKEREYLCYRKLVRSLRRGNIEAINSKKIDNRISK